MEDLSGMQCNDTRFGTRPKSAGEINGGALAFNRMFPASASTVNRVYVLTMVCNPVLSRVADRFPQVQDCRFGRSQRIHLRKAVKLGFNPSKIAYSKVSNSGANKKRLSTSC